MNRSVRLRLFRHLWVQACMLVNKQTPTDSPATGSYMHPTGPNWTDTRTHCHYCGTRGGTPALPVRSHYSTKPRARFRGGWTMSRARKARRQMSGLYTFLHLQLLLAPPLLLRALQECGCLHCCGAAQASLGATQSPARPPVGRRSATTSLPLLQHDGPWGGTRGSQGVRRYPCLAASRGRDGAAAATVAAQPLPPSLLLQHSGSALPGVGPPALPAAAFPLPSAGATRARPLPPSPDLRWSRPQSEGRPQALRRPRVPAT